MNFTLALLLLLFCTSTVFGQNDELAISFKKGENFYKKNCAVCHSKKGTGKGKRYPPLAGSDYLMNNRTESIKAVKYGLEGKITVNGVVYDKVMKAIDLNEEGIADVMNYVMNAWGNRSDKMVTEDEVSALLKD